MRSDHLVHARLDRSLSNNAWLEAFPSGYCKYLRFEGSDHRPFLTFLDDTRDKRKGMFRFDNRLREKDEFFELISATWSNADPATIDTKISRCRREITKWAKEQNQNSAKVIKEAQEALELALSSTIQDPDVIIKHTATLEKAYKEEELFWKQRSRVAWLNSGDLNTAYFHAITRNRRTINRFTVIEDEAGHAAYKEDDIASVISEYFQNIFSTNGDANLDVVAEVIQSCITSEMNDRLIRIPSDVEIKNATFSIHAEKAPGPDGFTAGFFQSFWTIIETDLVEEIKEFFQTSIFPVKMNETHIRLIPKSTSPKRVADYRPIALCNIYYKIVAKILTGRLQPILSSLISENQSVFVPNRSIFDNVLITHETLHYLKTSAAGKKGSMAVKTDMSKAYDRIEWSFLKEVCLRMGFHETWISWIMECVSTVSYSFLINGCPKGKVLPSRGLRQGDPLSPYLFILCTEVLSGLCKVAQENGTLPGVRVSRQSPLVNHLLFADDTMFFCKSNPTSFSTLSSILRRYEEASRQFISLAKSSITFSSKTPRSCRDRVKR